MRVSKLITAPAAEPLTLAEAKLHLRRDDDVTEDDALIYARMLAARQKAEQYTGRAFLTQTWEARFDGFGDTMWLPYPPLQSVSSVKYLDTSGTEQTVTAATYGVDTYGARARIWLEYGQSWPTPRTIHQAVRVRYVAGYGDNASDVPEPIRVAMLMMVGDLYENRETGVVGTVAADVKMSTTVEALLGPYRIAMP